MENKNFFENFKNEYNNKYADSSEILSLTKNLFAYFKDKQKEVNDLNNIYDFKVKTFFENKSQKDIFNNHFEHDVYHFFNDEIKSYVADFSKFWEKIGEDYSYPHLTNVGIERCKDIFEDFKDSYYKEREDNLKKSFTHICKNILKEYTDENGTPRQKYLTINVQEYSLCVHMCAYHTKKWCWQSEGLCSEFFKHSEYYNTAKGFENLRIMEDNSFNICFNIEKIFFNNLYEFFYNLSHKSSDELNSQLFNFDVNEKDYELTCKGDYDLYECKGYNTFKNLNADNMICGFVWHDTEQY